MINDDVGGLAPRVLTTCVDDDEEHDKELETQPLMDYGVYADPMSSAGMHEMAGGSLNPLGVGPGVGGYPSSFTQSTGYNRHAR
eukprot:6925138-Pyramimonas_sp.AAC.1